MAAPPSHLRQLEDRPVDLSVALLEWSPKMDILAVGSEDGTLTLYRLNWQKIWSVAPPAVGVSLRGLVWRWDGRVLATAYSTGAVQLREVESTDVLHEASLEVDLCSLHWVKIRPGEGEGDTMEDMMKKEDKEYNGVECKRTGLSTKVFDKPDIWNFLRKLPLLSKIYSSKLETEDETSEVQRFSEDSPATMLFVTTLDGHVALYMNGFLFCAKVNLNVLLMRENEKPKREKPCEGEPIEATLCDIRVRSVTMAPNLTSFCLVHSERGIPALRMTVFKFPLLKICLSELEVVAQKYSVLMGVLHYLDETLKQLTEAWEGIVVEMDEKLSLYAAKTESVATDFLELLMYGATNPALEHFLLSDLTEKGLQKLDKSADASYQNVQRLVLKYLHVVSQALNFHLNEFSGIGKSSDKFDFLGITPATVTKTGSQAASFWAKGLELQQVVDESRRNFKVFFRWLQSEILKLNGDPLPTDLAFVTQRDIKHIADFLSSFDLDEDDEDSNEEAKPAPAPAPKEEEADGDTPMNSSDAKTHRHLEKVGQYLRNEYLDQPVNRSKNPWHKFIQANPELLDIEFVVKVNEKTSLVQEYDLLRKSVTSIFKEMNLEMTDHCEVSGSVHIPFTGQEPFCSDRVLTCFAQTVAPALDDSTAEAAEEQNKTQGNQLLLLDVHCAETQHTLKAMTLTFGATDGQSALKLADGNFYNEETLTLLFSHCPATDHQRLYQVPLADCLQHAVNVQLFMFKHIEFTQLPTKNIAEIADQSCVRDLENLCAINMSVSGPRKVAAALFRGRRRVRIYDMEVEDDDDDDDDDEEEEEEEFGTSGLSSDLNTSG